MQLPGEPIGDNRQSSLASLRDQGKVSPVPAQGWGTVGLVTLQLRQWKKAAVGEVPQLNTGPTASFADHSQQPAIAAEGRLLLVAFRQSSSGALRPPLTGADGKTHKSQQKRCC